MQTTKAEFDEYSSLSLKISFKNTKIAQGMQEKMISFSSFKKKNNSETRKWRLPIFILFHAGTSSEVTSRKESHPMREVDKK
jgi:hypothetical protein